MEKRKGKHVSGCTASVLILCVKTGLCESGSVAKSLERGFFRIDVIFMIIHRPHYWHFPFEWL